MKKALKWALVFLGVPAVIVGLLAVDSYFRAVSAIAAHDARLKADIAAFRSKRQPFAIPKGRDVSLETLWRVRCPLALYRDPSTIALEGGHTVHETLWWIVEYKFAAPSRSLPTSPLPMETYLTALAVTQNLDEGGFRLRSMRSYDESLTLKDLAEELARNPPGTEKLRAISIELDQLLRYRPSFESVLDGESLLDRVEVLNVIHRRSDPLCWIQRPPGWREFFSWRILIAKCLNENADEVRRLRALPPEGFLVPMPSDHPEEEDRTRSRLWRLAHNQKVDEGICLAHWSMARLATAILRFRADQARDPSDLRELVPAYLPELPVDPIDRSPFVLVRGLLKSHPTYAASSTWDLGVK